MKMQMSRYTRQLFLFLVLAVASLGVSGLAHAGAGKGDDSSVPARKKGATVSADGNQLKAATNAGAALRKSKGKGRSTTQDDRLAAAKRNAARKAAAKVKGRQP